jgi:hypothetical protein
MGRPPNAPAVRSLSFPDLADEDQQVVVQTEEMIVASEMAVARSRQLIGQLDLAKLRRMREI